MQLLVLVAGDPASRRTFSGSARSLVRALERRGVVHAALNAATWWTDPWRPTRGLRGRARRLLDRPPLRLLLRLRESALGHQACSRRAGRLARSHPGHDACLIYGTSFFPPVGVPVYAYFDATAAQNARAGAWETAWLPSSAVTGVIDRQRRVFASCAGLFPRTAWTAATLGPDYGVPEEKVVVAGAGWNYQADPPPHGPYDRATVLFVGRDWERKGGPRLVAAFRRARRAIPHARLVVVGCRPPGLEREPGVTVTGPLDPDHPREGPRLLELYREASLFCLLSEYEPFGVVVVEALRSGVPCVVPDRFAFPEIVEDGVSGRVVHDDEALAATLVELLGDPARLEAMGAAAVDRARGRWSWDRAAERICARIEADLAR